MTTVSETGGGPPRVLIADDDPQVLKFLTDRCVRMGFRVHTASDGLSAFAIALRTPPDFLIVDVNMPQVDGLSLCARLLEPDRKGVDVVVITGNCQPEIIARCEAFGIIHVQKGPELWGIVRSALLELFSDRISPQSEIVARTKRSEMHDRPRVLIVDDDPDVGRFLCSRLRKYGLDTLLAPNGAAGYLMARDDKPSVVITDYFMPHGDAFYLLWKLRSTPATEEIPVFVISGRRLDAAIQASLQREICGHPGAARIFGKPLNFEELIGALQKFCGLDNRRSRLARSN